MRELQSEELLLVAGGQAAAGTAVDGAGCIVNAGEAIAQDGLDPLSDALAIHDCYDFGEGLHDMYSTSDNAENWTDANGNDRSGFVDS